MQEANELENLVLDLTAESGGGGGGGVTSYIDLSDKPKMNGTTIAGNKTSDDYSLQDKLVSGTNIKTINSTSLLGSGDIVTPTTDVQINGTSITSSNVANIPIASTSDFGTIKWGSSKGIKVDANGVIGLVAPTDGQVTAKANNDLALTLGKIDLAVRSVAPACTTITASDTTATITANSTYAHAVSSSGCTYTLTTPTDTSTVYNGFILLIDTTNSASIAFSTDGTPATSITISGNPTIQTGKKYTVTGQFSPISSAWELWIISYEV